MEGWEESEFGGELVFEGGEGRGVVAFAAVGGKREERVGGGSREMDGSYGLGYC